MPDDPAGKLPALLRDVRACQGCAASLPHQPRPILQAGVAARIVIIGQAPGRRVHESGIPWQDPSGDRLRDWMGVDQPTFYDPDRIALIPMGFCYPGTGPNGDLPPRPECAPLWHRQLLDLLPSTVLTLLVGSYALKAYLPKRSPTLGETIRRFDEHIPKIPLPHPSPRNQPWLRKHPWFETEVVPALQHQVAQALA